MSKSKKSASMNKELQEWIEETKEDIKSKKNKKQKDFSKKKPKGKCEICGEKTAESVCLKCGRNVCKGCYFKLISVCKRCIPSEIAGKWDGSRTDWEEELGVEWVE
jgi:hypothetical protein